MLLYLHSYSKLSRPFHCIGFLFFWLMLFASCSGMGPDSRVLVRKSRKQAEQYHRLYKVWYFYCVLFIQDTMHVQWIISKVTLWLKPWSAGSI